MTEKKSTCPLVSIVIPCYNHEKFVKEAIQGVIEQSYANIEFIIIDDGSSDSSVEMIKDMIPACQNRFKRFEFRYRPNKGLCETLNEALKWCHGEFYSAIGSDDIMCSNKTKIQVGFLQSNQDYVAVFGGTEVVDSQGRVKMVKNNFRFESRFPDLMLGKKIPAAPTQMIRLAAINAIGGYPGHLFIEDWYMWLKLTERGGCIANIPFILVKYRRHDSNISSQLDRMAEARRSILDQYRSHPLYRLAVSFSLLSYATDLQIADKKAANKLAISSIAQAPKVLFSKRMFYFILKGLVPMPTLRKRYKNTN